MTYSRKEILEIMNDGAFPLSLKYDPDWILENSMGSHTLWLQEALARKMNLKPGMKVLDLGCGKAASSIFLAKEFGVRVWAADLWTSPTENWARIREAGCADTVFPLKADGTALPFADDFFDAMTSINSIFYYAAGDGFLKNNILRHVKPGGEIGIVVPGFTKEYAELPKEYLPYIDYGLDKYHGRAWWEDCLLKSGLVEIVSGDVFQGNLGNELFKKSMDIYNEHESTFNALAREDLTFTGIVAKRKIQNA